MRPTHSENEGMHNLKKVAEIKEKLISSALEFYD
jgi:hypothetical protein